MTSLSKAKKDCVIKLSLTKVCFIGVESGVLGGISLWSEIQQVGLSCPQNCIATSGRDVRVVMTHLPWGRHMTDVTIALNSI